MRETSPTPEAFDPTHNTDLPNGGLPAVRIGDLFAPESSTEIMAEPPAEAKAEPLEAAICHYDWRFTQKVVEALAPGPQGPEESPLEYTQRRLRHAQGRTWDDLMRGE